MSVQIKVTTPGRYSFGMRGEKETLREPGHVEITYEDTVNVNDPVVCIEVKRGDQKNTNQLYMNRDEFDAFKWAFNHGFGEL